LGVLVSMSMQRDEQVNIQCPQYHIKYSTRQCGGLLIFITRRGFNSEYKCEKCGQKVSIVEGMSAKEIENFERVRRTSGVRYK